MAISIVSREKWGARAPKGVPRHSEWPRSGVDLWLHHSAGDRSQTPREIQAFHQNTRGWNDISYSYLVDYEGVIYEGRGFEVWGAHSAENGKNGEPSVCLIGDYSKTEPSDAQHRAVYALKDYLGARKIRGHRENTPTSCPGDAAYKKIVQGPPPAKPLRYFFERLHPKTGKRITLWREGGYQKKLNRDLHYTAVKCGHPTWVLRKFSKPL
jgi:hypothetical protein